MEGSEYNHELFVNLESRGSNRQRPLKQWTETTSRKFRGIRSLVILTDFVGLTQSSLDGPFEHKLCYSSRWNHKSRGTRLFFRIVRKFKDKPNKVGLMIYACLKQDMWIRGPGFNSKIFHIRWVIVVIESSDLTIWAHLERHIRISAHVIRFNVH